MKITSLVENTSHTGLKSEHGLSLHITLSDGTALLFDMGQSPLFAENASRLGIDLSKVDTAILSHGHYDHGGGLPTFLSLNATAPVFIHSKAFEPHYSLKESGLKYIGIADLVTVSRQMIMTDLSPLASGSSLTIGSHLTLFWDVTSPCLLPPGNSRLFGPAPDTPDDFCHEQSLLIEEDDKTVLIAGCAHKGIVNIMRKAEAISRRPLTHVFAGMHLKNDGLTPSRRQSFISDLCSSLMSFPRCRYYTMHCTGDEAYRSMLSVMGPRISYLSAGESVEI